MALEVISDLGIELNDLNYLRTHVYLTSESLHELHATTEEAKYHPLTSCLRPK